MIFLKFRYVFNLVSVVVFVLVLSMLFLLERGEESRQSFGELHGVTVMIDAGHGGEDGGAKGPDGILEKQINLVVSEKLEHIMNLCGVNTDMTRRSDDALFFDERSSLRKRKVADIKKRVEKIQNTPQVTLISVHQNSFPQDNCKGAQVFFSKSNANSKLLANNVQSALKAGIDENNRRVEKQNDKTIYILENVNCPAILVECGFLTNHEEAKLLKKDTYQTKLAMCIAAGFLRYQNEK